MIMRNTLSILEPTYREITDAVFSVAGLEGAAYLLCGVSATDDERRLLGREVVPVRDEHYLVRDADRLSIASDSYAPVAKRSRQSQEAVVFVHSHPAGYPNFSKQDDIEEGKLHAFFRARSPDLPHGSLLFSNRDAPKARIFGDGAWHSVELIRVLGNRFRFAGSTADSEPLPEFFDRQVRAFGPDIQRLLRRMHIGVVGAGGTGSAVIEQLTRLGVGRLSVFDGESLVGSNVTRVYGSRLRDEGEKKAIIQAAHVKQIGFGTHFHCYPSPITDKETARRLRECDVIFGCTDKHAPRGILCRLSTRYLIPVIDVAVKIDAPEAILRGIWGRVTTVFPGEACLFCRERIDPEIIRAESLPPEQREREIAEGYIRGLATDEPAVIMFTTAVAAHAIAELLHRLTGFMGAERRSSEVLLPFHEGRIRTNRDPAKPDCQCQQREHWGCGDRRRFLGYTW